MFSFEELNFLIKYMINIVFTMCVCSEYNLKSDHAPKLLLACHSEK